MNLVARMGCWLAICGALLATPGPAPAAGPEVAETEPAVAAPAAPPWRFNVMPYVWMQGMSGTIRPTGGGSTIDFERSFSDTDGAVFLSFGAERGRLIMFGDFQRVSTTRSGELAGGIPASGSLDVTTLSLAVGYRAVASPRGVVDVFGGLRAFDLQADVTAAGGAISSSPSRGFVDPIIGVRAIVPFSPRLSSLLYVDVGGFGVGTESAVVASATLNYKISDSVTLSGGYRSMWIDYEEGGTRVDVELGGPVLGLNFRF